MSQDIFKEIVGGIPYEKEIVKIQNNIKKKISETNTEGVVFGLSGGIDSAVIAYLCNNAVKDKILAIIMPDSRISPESETNDAIQIVDKLGINYKLLDINLIHQKVPGLWKARNLAIRNARGEYILFFDDDSRIGSDWIKEHLKSIDYFKAVDDVSFFLPFIINFSEAQAPRSISLHLSEQNGLLGLF